MGGRAPGGAVVTGTYSRAFESDPAWQAWRDEAHAARKHADRTIRYAQKKHLDDGEARDAAVRAALDQERDETVAALKKYRRAKGRVSRESAETSATTALP